VEYFIDIEFRQIRKKGVKIFQHYLKVKKKIMIISRTPHRISFFGGGTDYPSFYLEHGGKVLGTTIDKYCYLTCRELPPYFEYKYRVLYSKNEATTEIDDIQHPVVRTVLNYFDTQKGLEIHHDGDVPARSGMGSSSAFTVGLLKAMHALEGRITSKEELAKEAIHIEQKLIKENVGSQDQVFAAHGGLNTIEFLPSGEIVVKPIILSQDQLSVFESKFMLFFTGISRIASNIASEQIKNIPKRSEELFKMKNLVDDAYAILTEKKKDFRQFGELLDCTWKLKRKLSNKITTNHIDEIYETAIQNGAIGGKLLGAGGGGFILFYVEPENQQAVKKALSNYLYIPFKIDFTGSDIIVYQPNYSNSVR